jgi:hypothetical protein
MRTFIVKYTIGDSDRYYIWTDTDGQKFRFTTIAKAVHCLNRFPELVNTFARVDIVPE